MKTSMATCLLFAAAANAEQQFLRPLTDPRKLQRDPTSGSASEAIDESTAVVIITEACTPVQCFYPQTQDPESCLCTYPAVDCTVPQATCLATQSWNVEQCKCVEKSALCSRKEVCYDGKVWSWAYCSCKEPSQVCSTRLRCRAHEEYDPLNCICKVRRQNGTSLGASGYYYTFSPDDA